MPYDFDNFFEAFVAFSAFRSVILQIEVSDEVGSAVFGRVHGIEASRVLGQL
jgi:hypothetical protein